MGLATVGSRVSLGWSRGQRDLSSCAGLWTLASALQHLPCLDPPFIWTESQAAGTGT